MKQSRRSHLQARMHVWIALMWVALIAPTIFWWSESILWVLMISIYANIASHWGAYQGSKSAEAGALPDEQ